MILIYFSESNNQRLLLGDSGPIPIPGTGKQNAAGQKGNRQDQKKYIWFEFTLKEATLMLYTFTLNCTELDIAASEVQSRSNRPTNT